MELTKEEPGTLAVGEYHPAARHAYDWIRKNILDTNNAMDWLQAFGNCSVENKLAEICSGTLKRLINKQPISDRYLLGLAWTLRSMVEEKE